MQYCAILLHQSIADLTYPWQLNWFIDWNNLDVSTLSGISSIFRICHIPSTLWMWTQYERVAIFDWLYAYLD
jgi:hypothetical protein